MEAVARREPDDLGIGGAGALGAVSSAGSGAGATTCDACRHEACTGTAGQSRRRWRAGRHRDAADGARRRS
jgi:hypothetical protein